MKRSSLKSRILLHLQRHGGWVNGAFYERMAENEGFKGSNASRRLRELHNEGEIERQMRKGKRVKSVWYRAKQKYVRVPYILDDGEVIHRKELWKQHPVTQ